MKSTIGSPKHVVKVTHVSPDRTAAYLELRNGATATLTHPAPLEVSLGDILFINQEWNEFTPAPRELWREEPWVGVVRLLKDNKAVVDIGGKLRSLPTAGDLALQEGNTVEGFDSIGITSVLSERPLRYLDIGLNEPVTVDRFKRQPGTSPSFADFGGFTDIVDRARELIQVPLQRHDALRKIGARPIKGVLFTGQSGVGKTLLARIIANEAGVPFYEISGPQILSKWYGESEDLIRKIFDDAARQERAIVFFDEIDSIAAQRNDASHEASRRVVGQLLTSIDGFRSETNVIVVATTNRPGDIDVALRRPGRFDWEVHFPLPSRVDREAVLSTSARKLNVQDGLPHALIAEKSDSWSSAELAAIWSEAALLAVQDQREVILEEDYFGGFERVAAQRARVVADKHDEYEGNHVR